MCACVRARVRSADEGPGPRGGREAADSTLWMTLGCRPGTVFCSSAFLLGWGPSYYAIFQELLDPAFFFFFASPVVFCLSRDLGLGLGLAPGSAPALPRKAFGGGQVPLPASPAPAFPRPQRLWEPLACRHIGALLTIPPWPTHLENCRLCLSNLSHWLLSVLQICHSRQSPASGSKSSTPFIDQAPSSRGRGRGWDAVGARGRAPHVLLGLAWRDHQHL